MAPASCCDAKGDVRISGCCLSLGVQLREVQQQFGCVRHVLLLVLRVCAPYAAVTCGVWPCVGPVLRWQVVHESAGVTCLRHVMDAAVGFSRTGRGIAWVGVWCVEGQGLPERMRSWYGVP